MHTRGSRQWRGGGAALAALAAIVLQHAVLGSGTVRAEDKDAHALAQKFAEEATPDPAAAAADEAGQARRREAEARQEAAQKAAAEAKRKAAEAKRRADAARRVALQARIDEQDMLTRARAEAAERAAEERALQAEIDRREADRAAIAAEVEAQDLDKSRTPADREADAERLIEAAKAADAARKTMEEARAEEARRLSEKLKLAQEKRAALDAAKAAQQAARAAVLQSAPPPDGEQTAAAPASGQLPAPSLAGAPSGPDGSASLPERSAPAAVPAAPAVVAAVPPPGVLPRAAPETREPETRVTVLILMNPGNRGIRRTNKTADPVLCLGPDCYVSKGSEVDARHVTRWQALGTFNTLGKRAGACNNSLGCVFRNVDLGAVRAMLQPIDLRVMHHDRRETREVRADPTCEMVGSRLTCAAGIKASDYRLWVVPESVARRAGPAALDAAVKGGLIDGGRV